MLIPIKPKTKLRTGKFLTKIKNACQKKLTQNYFDDNIENNSSVFHKFQVDETSKGSKLFNAENGIHNLKSRPISMLEKRISITQRKPQRTPDITLNSRRESGFSVMSKDTKPTTRDQKCLNAKTISRYAKQQK